MVDDALGSLPDRVEWERESPATYLLEALTALLELFDPHGPRGTIGAAGHRVRWARISVMFSAFAAEGYINRVLLSSPLNQRDFDAIDRLPTLDKYAIGPRLALGQNLFDRGQEPLQTLAELFGLRNTLAHPKPRSETITRAEALAGPDAETFSPTRAVRFITAVAEAANVLASASGERTEQETLTELIVGMKPWLLERATDADLLPRPTYADYREAYSRALSGRGEAGAIEPPSSK
jgi:hypothetical protein